MAQVQLGQTNVEETVPVNLYNADGKFVRTINTNPAFATRYIEIFGRKYERVPDDEAQNVRNAWRDIGEAPHTATSGVVDDD